MLLPMLFSGQIVLAQRYLQKVTINKVTIKKEYRLN